MGSSVTLIYSLVGRLKGSLFWDWASCRTFQRPIIIQLLTTVIPKLEQLAKEGESGRRKMQQYIRYTTIFICVVQAGANSRWMASHEGVIVVNCRIIGCFLVFGGFNHNHRDHVFDVVRRADNGKRHRQWDFVDYFCWHCC